MDPGGVPRRRRFPKSRLFQKRESGTLASVILLGKWGCYNAVGRRHGVHRTRTATKLLEIIVASASGRMRRKRTHEFFRHRRPEIQKAAGRGGIRPGSPVARPEDPPCSGPSEERGTLRSRGVAGGGFGDHLRGEPGEGTASHPGKISLPRPRSPPENVPRRTVRLLFPRDHDDRYGSARLYGGRDVQGVARSLLRGSVPRAGREGRSEERRVG